MEIGNCFCLAFFSGLSLSFFFFFFFLFLFNNWTLIKSLHGDLPAKFDRNRRFIAFSVRKRDVEDTF